MFFFLTTFAPHPETGLTVKALNHPWSDFKETLTTLSALFEQKRLLPPTSQPRGWTGCSWIIMWLRSIIHLFLSRKVGFIIVNCVSRMLCTRWLLSHVCFLVSVHRKAVTVWQTVYVTARVPGGTFPSKTSFVKLHIRTFWDWWLSSAPLLNKFRS